MLSLTVGFSVKFPMLCCHLWTSEVTKSCNTLLQTHQYGWWKRTGKRSYHGLRYLHSADKQVAGQMLKILFRKPKTSFCVRWCAGGCHILYAITRTPGILWNNCQAWDMVAAHPPCTLVRTAWASTQQTSADIVLVPSLQYKSSWRDSRVCRS